MFITSPYLLKFRKKTKANLIITLSINNTMLTLIDNTGNVLIKVSAGIVGLKGPKKPTFHAAEVMTKFLAKQAHNKGIKYIDVIIYGPIHGKIKLILRTLKKTKLKVKYFFNFLKIAHNGMRKKKLRRM